MNFRNTSRDARSYFAALILAQRLGVLGKEQVMAEADHRILEQAQPDFWLIEVSMNAESEVLQPLIESGDEAVYKGALRIAYQAWLDGSISDRGFGLCCETLCKQTRPVYHEWYSDLVWIVDEFDLVAQGVFRRGDSVMKVQNVIEELLTDLTQR